MVPPAAPKPDNMDDRAVEETNDEADEDMNDRVDADVDDRAKRSRIMALFSMPTAETIFQTSVKCIYCRLKTNSLH